MTPETKIKTQTCNCPHTHNKPRKLHLIETGAVCIKQLVVIVVWFAIMTLFAQFIPTELYEKRNVPFALIIMFLTGVLALSLHDFYCKCKK